MAFHDLNQDYIPEFFLAGGTRYDVGQMTLTQKMYFAEWISRLDANQEQRPIREPIIKEFLSIRNEVDTLDHIPDNELGGIILYIGDKLKVDETDTHI